MAKHKFLLLLVFPFFGYTQVKDSLAHRLFLHKEEDSLKVSLMVSYSRQLLFSRPDSMMYFADEALRIARKINNRFSEASALQSKGVAFHYVERDPVSAIDYYQQAQTAVAPLNRKDFEWKNLANIAILRYDLRDFAGAKGLYDSAIAIQQSLNDKAGEEQLLANAANVYFDSGDTAKAITTYKKALELAEQKSNKQVIPLIVNNLGSILIWQNQMATSDSLLERGYAMGKALNIPMYQMQANCYRAVLNLKRGNYATAEKFAKESLQLANQLNNQQFQRENWEVLGEVYKKTSRKDLALEAVDKVLEYEVAAHGDDKQRAVIVKDMELSFARKEARLTADYEKEVALAEAENQRQRLIRNTAIGVALLIIAGLVAGYFLYKKRLEARRLQKEAELQAEISETEMKALRAQMNPHFIFNSLNSISDYISKNKTQLADTYLTKFAKLMRLILENSEHKEVPLADDLQALELYMQLESLRLNNKFEYTIDVDENLDTGNTLVPPLLLQPFVENSIWHGIARKEGPGRITVSVTRENDMLKCTVEDDGVGRFSKSVSVKPDSSSHKKSLGMKITRERIDMINKTTGSKADILITDLEPGTRVEVILPLVA